MPGRLEAEQEAVFTSAFSFTINQRQLKRIERDYLRCCCDQQCCWSVVVFSIRDRRTEDEMEIRRLRTENLLVRQKLDQLEQESSELADRLIQDQVTRAEEEERRFLLVAELEETRERLQQQTSAVGI